MDNRLYLKEQLALLWKRFETWEIPVHSLLFSCGKELLWETYRPPYQAGTLHRMFSITKSYTSLAIGCLAAEGRLRLDDPIISFFPEYLPADTKPHPYLADMTIRHMLAMQTCHSATTYKQHSDRNWVESFFITPPTHKSGQIFMYDTSSSHTLAALVKKLTGMGVLDYLRTQFPDTAGISEKAYIITDPFGSEMGGSGLMARPGDLMVTAGYLMEQIRHGKDAFSDYLREAVSVRTPTLHTGQTLDEQQGYGYQFWRIRGGFAMYGMGGQYVLFYPEADVIAVITADTQNIKGGNQKILDAIHDLLTSACPEMKTHASAIDGQSSQPDSTLTGKTGSTRHYRLEPNTGGFTELTITMESGGGMLTLTHPETVYNIPFGWDPVLQTAVIAKYKQFIASSGRWLDDQSLLIYTQLAGECVGSLSFMLHFRIDGITLWMKKIEETLFDEFTGFAEGNLTHSVINS